MVNESDLLNLVLQATQRGRLIWRSLPGADRYEAEAYRYLYRITFKSPLLDNGMSADTTLYSVSVAEVLITFADGSPLVEVIHEILAAGVDEWKHHRRFVQMDIDAAYASLSSLIDG